MMLMLRISLRWDDVDVDDDIEMMLMILMILRWDDVDVDDVIVMMYVVYVHGGCNDQVGCPWWGK